MSRTTLIEQAVEGFELLVEYDPETGKCIITVTLEENAATKVAEYVPLHVPQFGLDSEDSNEILQIAERLCQEFESEAENND